MAHPSTWFSVPGFPMRELPLRARVLIQVTLWTAICCHSPVPPNWHLNHPLVLTCIYMKPPTSTFLQITLLNDQDFWIRTCGLMWLTCIFKKSYLKKIKSQLRALVRPCNTKAERMGFLVALPWPGGHPVRNSPVQLPARAELSQQGKSSLSKLRSRCLLPCAMWEVFPSWKQLPAGAAAALPQVGGREMGWWPQHLQEQRQEATPDQLVCGILAPFEMITPWQGLSMIKKHLRHLTGKKRGKMEPSGHHAFKEPSWAAWQSA